METRNEMLKLIRNRRDGFSLEQPFYIDPEFYKVDLELIWYRDWLFVGHDCEVAKAGSFFTVQVVTTPWLSCAGATGSSAHSQFLPSSRQPRLHHRQGKLGAGWFAPTTSGPMTSTASWSLRARWPMASTRRISA